MNIAQQESYFQRTQRWLMREFDRHKKRRASQSRDNALHDLSCRAEQLLRRYEEFEKVAYKGK